MMKATFFPTPEDFRAWLEENHDKQDELIVGYYKKATKKPSITWPESVAEALCYGWIDGIRRKIDEEAYCIRFTPRRPNSTWSAVNIKMMDQLLAEGRVQPSGLAAWERRKTDNSEIYGYEQKTVELTAEYKSLFKKESKAWTFFEEQAPYYRKTANWWIMSAKKEETRLRRLNQLIEVSLAGERLPQLGGKPSKKK